MKIKMTLFATLLTLGATLLTGCGGSGGAESDTKADTATYTAHFTSADYDTFSAKPLFPSKEGATCVNIIPNSGDQGLVDYTLEIFGDTYTLISDFYTADPSTGKRYKVGDDSGIAITIKSVATGKVKESSDDAITIDAADSVTYSIPEKDCDSIGKEQMAPMFSFAAVDAETACGEWTSKDLPELLDAVPETTFTVSDGTITSWK